MSGNEMRSGAINWADMMDTGQESGSVETVFTTEKVAQPVQKPVQKGMGVETLSTEHGDRENQIQVATDGADFAINLSVREWVSDRQPTAEEIVSHGGYFRIQKDGKVRTVNIDAYDNVWYEYNARTAEWVPLEGKVTWLNENFPEF